MTGVDFVRAQIEIARGRDGSTRSIGLTSERRLQSANGHAIEVRVYAEDPDEGFLPSPG